MSLKIDAHHHLWRYDREEYPWIGDSMQVLQRDFTVQDLERELRRIGIDCSIAVQARQTTAETGWLLSLADSSNTIAGVVGWVPLVEPDVKRHLENFGSHEKLVGVRHVVQDEPDPDFILRADFNRGIEALSDFRLVYDILIFERQLPQAVRFVDRHRDQIFVVDHIAKPRIREGSFTGWARSMSELGERENVFCKISGMVTEASPDWKADDFVPYLDHLFEVFGAERLMFGSDWPVCLLAASYPQWHTVLSGYCEALSTDERERVFGRTAEDVYFYSLQEE